MRGNLGFVGKRVRTRMDRKVEMALFLAGCTDAALDRTTVGDLVARYSVDARVAEYEILLAKQRRAA